MKCKKCGSSKVDSQWGDDEHGNCGDVYTCRECGRQWDDKEEIMDEFSRPMPQTKPMSAEDLGWYFWHECIDGSDFEGIDYDIEKFAKKAKERDAQRDREILTKAADRHCIKTCNPKGYREEDYHCRICPDRRAILEPLDEKEGS